MDWSQLLIALAAGGAGAFLQNLWGMRARRREELRRLYGQWLGETYLWLTALRDHFATYPDDVVPSRFDEHYTDITSLTSQLEIVETRHDYRERIQGIAAEIRKNHPLDPCDLPEGDGSDNGTENGLYLRARSRLKRRAKLRDDLLERFATPTWGEAFEATEAPSLRRYRPLSEHLSDQER